MKSILAKWSLVYPVHFLRCEWILFYISEVEKVEQMNGSDLDDYQERKISYMLKNSYRKVPYYKNILTSMGAPESLNRPFDIFHKLPFLDKETINQESTKLSLLERVFLDQRSTSGSTGVPLVFYKDRQATGYMEAVQNQAYKWHGINVGAPQGRFWGMPTGSKRNVNRVKDFLKNRIRFSAFDLTDDAKEAYFKELCKFRPMYLYGYSSLMLEFARYFGQRRLESACLPLQVVIGTGEFITNAEKDELAYLFGVPFAGEYGCTEIGVIGLECQYGKMHLIASNVYLEVVDPAGRSLEIGEEGEIVVTELNAGYFPFIRYRLGDRGRLTGEACLCGRSLPVFEIMAGRKDDYILTPEGRKIYDAILAYTLKKGVKQFQGVQEKIDYLRILICPDEYYTDDLEYNYICKLKESLGPMMNIEIELVKEIPREISGKLRYFRSMLKKDKIEVIT